MPSSRIRGRGISMLTRSKCSPGCERLVRKFATSLTGEVFYRKFANRRKLGRYVGLDGSPFRSGSVERDQGISKAGNPVARSMMVELAWTWFRYQPANALSIWFPETRRNPQ